jgi:hypothetical protein
MKLKKLLLIGAAALVGALLGDLYWAYMGYDENYPFISTVGTSMLCSSALCGLLTAILMSEKQIEAS